MPQGLFSQTPANASRDLQDSDSTKKQLKEMSLTDSMLLGDHKTEEGGGVGVQCEATAASKAGEHDTEAQKDEQHVQLNSFHSKVSINDCKYEEDSVVLETHRSQ